MAKTLHRWVTHYRAAGIQFFGANSVYATVATTVVTHDAWRTIAADYLPWLAVIVVLLEVATIVVVLMLNKAEHTTEGAALFPDDPVEEVVLRFARQEDYARLMTVYRQWFPDDVSIDPAEYQLILARGRFARLAEQVHQSGLKKPAGDYSVWPISEATFTGLVEGRIAEKDITSAMVLDPDAAEARILYVPEIYVSKDCELGPALLRDAKAFVLTMLQGNPQLTGVAAWPYTEVGKSLCQRFFMTKCLNHAGKPTAYRLVSREKLPAAGDSAAAKFHAVRRIRM